MPRVDSSLVPVVFDLERGLRELGIPFGIVGALVPELLLDVRPRLTHGAQQPARSHLDITCQTPRVS